MFGSSLSLETISNYGIVFENAVGKVERITFFSNYCDNIALKSGLKVQEVLKSNFTKKLFLKSNVQIDSKMMSTNKKTEELVSTVA